METWPGSPQPLGAVFDGSGTNFAIFSEVAQQVELCLFDDEGRETRAELPERTGFVWHGYLPRVGPGQRYGYRVHGPFEPEKGHLCQASKLVIDPYARAIDGPVRWHEAVFPHRFDDPNKVNELDSAPYMPRCVVVNPYFDWDNDRPPRTPWHETVIYEVHVKGFTQLHPDVPLPLRGTYAGLAHPAMIRHLRNLGVTAVELLPVHHFVHDQRLVQRGLRNFWGYNSIGYFAPHDEYASTPRRGGQVQEFRRMVKGLHQAGIEVILDVVYNHTAEGGSGGPVLSFRGIDNHAYYKLAAEDPRRYVDYTGCGNSMNMRHPNVLQLIMDSLRYWVLEMHVDGFRFDLASALARELHEVDRLSAFFDLIQQDPVLQRVKLIAEPWDLGEGGYQVGNFPPQWSEWNGKYRDTARDFWRGQDTTLGELAYRLTGSSDLYSSSGRRPHASINFITCHDGFTLGDLVSYNDKHNEANTEENRDGESHNRSWNMGVEGPTEDVKILELRARQRRNFMATLFLAQGVPMLLAGDEIGRSQGGNNNAYCQDNEVSWIDWLGADTALREFTRDLIALRRDHPVFRRRRWFQGREIRGSDQTDIGWFRPDGSPMTDDDWRAAPARGLGVFLNGDGIESRDGYGYRVRDDSFYIMFNAGHEPASFKLPPVLATDRWIRVFDTVQAEFEPPHGKEIGPDFTAAPRSVVLLRRA
ncbi:MAG TPA: glycogen debranching protein GlgX [Kofleriaceae bacterium]